MTNGWRIWSLVIGSWSFSGAAAVTEPARTYRVAYITAGAAGMFCGSCMHDNTLVAALARQ